MGKLDNILGEVSNKENELEASINKLNNQSTEADVLGIMQRIASLSDDIQIHRYKQKLRNVVKKFKVLSTPAFDAAILTAFRDRIQTINLSDQITMEELKGHIKVLQVKNNVLKKRMLEPAFKSKKITINPDFTVRYLKFGEEIQRRIACTAIADIPFSIYLYQFLIEVCLGHLGGKGRRYEARIRKNILRQMKTWANDIRKKIQINSDFDPALQEELQRWDEKTPYKNTEKANILMECYNFQVDDGGRIYLYNESRHIYERFSLNNLTRIYYDLCSVRSVLGDTRIDYNGKVRKDIFDIITAHLAERGTSDVFMNPQAEHYATLANGVLDIRAKRLKPHSPSYLSTVHLPLVYDPKAKADKFISFIEQAMDNDQDAIRFCQQWFGYHLIALTKFNKALLCVGEGGNGKGVFINVLEAFCGGYNVSSVQLQDFGDNRFKLAELDNKLANMQADLSANQITSVAASLLKSITSGDRLNAEQKMKDPYNFRPFAKLTFSMNTLPATRDKTEGFWDRIIVLPFDRRFRGTADDNPNLSKELTTKQELSGILNWALDGLESLLDQEVFVLSKNMKKAMGEYKHENDPIQGFIEEHLTITDDRNAKVHKKDIYAKFQTANIGFKGTDMSQPAFIKQLKKRIGEDRDQTPDGKTLRNEFGAQLWGVVMNE